MNTADTLIAAAIENAVAREAEFKFMKKIGIHASGSVETPFGTLAVNFVTASGRTVQIAAHMRKTFTLKGKRIALANLQTLLNA